MLKALIDWKAAGRGVHDLVRGWHMQPTNMDGIGPAVTVTITEKHYGFLIGQARITLSEQFMAEAGPEVVDRLVAEEIEAARGKWASNKWAEVRHIGKGEINPHA